LIGVGGLWCLALLSTIFELEKGNQVCKARFSVLLFVSPFYIYIYSHDITEILIKFNEFVSRFNNQFFSKINKDLIRIRWHKK
jgi:hypothetical protein